ncbi:TIGR00374 family protein [Mycobacterium xenopi 3993]|nr:TIGR00374 family protein [Mycobacterium xenopi 3993]
MLSWVNSLRGKPADTGLEKWRETLTQLEAVSLSRRDLGVAFSWSLFNWIADVACLGFAAYAAGDKASLAGLTVAYAAARAVGTIPLMPGGLLVVEAVLVPGLVSSGMSLPDAISAMLVYRVISWLLIAAIGWVVFFFMFRTENEVDPTPLTLASTGRAATKTCRSPTRPATGAVLRTVSGGAVSAYLTAVIGDAAAGPGRLPAPSGGPPARRRAFRQPVARQRRAGRSAHPASVQASAES